MKTLITLCLLCINIALSAQFSYNKTEISNSTFNFLSDADTTQDYRETNNIIKFNLPFKIGHKGDSTSKASFSLGSFSENDGQNSYSLFAQALNFYKTKEEEDNDIFPYSNKSLKIKRHPEYVICESSFIEHDNFPGEYAHFQIQFFNTGVLSYKYASENLSTDNPLNKFLSSSVFESFEPKNGSDETIYTDLNAKGSPENPDFVEYSENTPLYLDYFPENGTTYTFYPADFVGINDKNSISIEAFKISKNGNQLDILVLENLEFIEIISTDGKLISKELNLSTGYSYSIENPIQTFIIRSKTKSGIYQINKYAGF